MDAIYIELKPVLLQCKHCGVRYWLPSEYVDARHEDNKLVWYCPNGHPWHFAESNEEILEAKLKEERESRENLEFELAAQRGALKAERARVARLKKRIANGVCPCCHRSFVQLARHMNTQHPEYSKEE